MVEILMEEFIEEGEAQIRVRLRVRIRVRIYGFEPLVEEVTDTRRHTFRGHATLFRRLTGPFHHRPEAYFRCCVARSFTPCSLHLRSVRENVHLRVVREKYDVFFRDDGLTH